IWKAPFTVNGTLLWVGAATHDIGFERDQRNNGVTHKIDPDIDLERDYVQKTLSSTGLVVEVSHFLPDNPMKEAKTATGGSFHSSGQVLVLRLADSGKDLSASFARMFCSVLRSENPDGGEWDGCASYLKSEQPLSLEPGSLDRIPADYRVLVIPGILSSCQANTQAFAEGQTHLREKHGLTVEFLQTPNESSTANGARIAKYLKENSHRGAAKYVVGGKRRGPPNIRKARTNDAQARNRAAAFIGVAGAAGVPPIAKTRPAIVERYSSTLKLGSCEGDMAEAFKSL